MARIISMINFDMAFSHNVSIGLGDSCTVSWPLTPAERRLCSAKPIFQLRTCFCGDATHATLSVLISCVARARVERRKGKGGFAMFVTWSKCWGRLFKSRGLEPDINIISTSAATCAFENGETFYYSLSVFPENIRNFAPLYRRACNLEKLHHTSSPGERSSSSLR